MVGDFEDFFENGGVAYFHEASWPTDMMDIVLQVAKTLSHGADNLPLAI